MLRRPVESANESAAREPRAEGRKRIRIAYFLEVNDAGSLRADAAELRRRNTCDLCGRVGFVEHSKNAVKKLHNK
jgi:hypothetical protein